MAEYKINIDIDAGDLKNISNQVDQRFQEIYNSVGRGRFALSVLLASMSEHFLEGFEGEGAGTGKTQTWDYCEQALDRLIRYLDRVLADLNMPGDRSRDDMVIEHALKRLRRRHERGLPWPDGRSALKLAVGEVKSGIKALEAQRSILWHLAVIGQPVTSQVLADCPLLREKLMGAMSLPTGAVKDDAAVLAALEALLEILHLRCLIFRVNSSPNRYSLHRLVQRHFFRSLGAPFVEYPYADQYTISLYATQPNELPTLEPDAHRDLRLTVAGLIDFPLYSRPQSDDEVLLNSAEPVPADKEEALLARRARKLRAALGILRSIYSVAVIARFDDRHANELPRESQVGFFEGHRQLVRWIIRKAVAWDHAVERLPLSAGLGERMQALRPFYAEDIAWLFNECGVLSYAQGRIADAAFTLDLARRFVEQNLEPLPDGPIRARIALNRAAVDIDAGRALRRSSDTVMAMQSLAAREWEHPVPRLLARGYLALVGRWRGDARGVGEFQAVIDGLRTLGRSRGASMFARHLAALHRDETGFDAARKAIDDAVRLALDGRHEDIRQAALMTALSITFHSLRGSGRSEDDRHRGMERLRHELTAIDLYAETMGLPRLTAEVLTLKGEIQLTGGDFDRAGEDIIRSLQIASLHDMRLRKLTGLVLLAQIEARRSPEGVTALLELAKDIASRIEAHAANAHYDQILREFDPKLSH
ncbi:hypothetical protein [Azospirillum sp. B4]|uniref:hypothetical protein n=1 Tax=Azospirillum sp. B4 TaxID=95605 RepID=UPI00034504F1|nr:hypothetical protein [Azospirillum sp. B4]